MSGQFHLDAATYLDMIRAEIGDYDALQAALADDTVGIAAERILDLGSGTGETARAVLERHTGAALVGIDASAEMLAVARSQVPGALFVESRLEDPLPPGPFDLVVSAFAIHHLDGDGKADLFRRIAAEIRSGGRFVLLDVVVPSEPIPNPIALETGVDIPSPIDAQLRWLSAAGFEPEVVVEHADLAILAGTRR